MFVDVVVDTVGGRGGVRRLCLLIYLCPKINPGKDHTTRVRPWFPNEDRTKGLSVGPAPSGPSTGWTVSITRHPSSETHFVFIFVPLFSVIERQEDGKEGKIPILYHKDGSRLKDTFHFPPTKLKDTA